MCFRPAEAGVESSISCPDCGRKITAAPGVVLKTCPFCKCDFTPYLNGEKELPGGPKAPSAPKAPGA